MPAPVSKEEIKTIQLSILRHFHDFCTRYELRYYLAYGTLLGAIRHKGYIPWDDDIDLMMPRPDYLRFIDLFDQTENGPLKVVCIQNNPLYFTTFAKIIDTRTVMYQEYGFIEKAEIGVYVDIFPLDGIPDKEKEAEDLDRRTNRWGAAYRLAMRKFSAKSSNPIKWVIKGLLSVPFRIIGPHYFITRLEAMGMANDYDQSSSVFCITSDKGVSKKFQRKHLEENELAEFEGESYPIPANAGAYLTKMYGDWMTPPPDEQKQQHFYTVFWK